MKDGDGSKLVTIGLFVAAGVVIYRKFISKPVTVTPAQPSAGLGALAARGFERHKYKAVRRGGQTACYDVITRQRVPAHLCEAEMTAGVGGVFGGKTTLG